MKLEISVQELVNLVKEIKDRPTNILEMINVNVQKEVGWNGDQTE